MCLYVCMKRNETISVVLSAVRIEHGGSTHMITVANFQHSLFYI